MCIRDRISSTGYGESRPITSNVNEKLGGHFKYLSYPVNKGKGGALKYGASQYNLSLIHI